MAQGEGSAGVNAAMLLCGYGLLLLVAVTQFQRARSAERRAKQYLQTCEDLRGALKRQGAALQNLMNATERLRNATDLPPKVGSSDYLESTYGNEH